MQTKHVLFIDDEDISQTIDKLRNVLKKQGITLVDEFFHIKPSYRKQDPNERDQTVLDFGQIKEDLKSGVMKKMFDYVACDFNFKDDGLNGFRLIKWLKNVARNEKHKIRTARFSLFSSELDKSIKETFSENDIADLIRLKIEDFYDRSRISEDLGQSVISNAEEIDLKEELVKHLSNHESMTFRSGYPKFKGMTLKQIVDEIQSDTYHGIGFQVALIEHCVTHMISLNEE
jgi:hypothetical protein